MMESSVAEFDGVTSLDKAIDCLWSELTAPKIELKSLYVGLRYVFFRLNSSYRRVIIDSDLNSVEIVLCKQVF